jgi:hypothetical protein
MEHLSEASGELRKTQWADMTYAGIQVAIWTTLLKEVMADVSMLSEGAQDRAARALLAFSRLRRLADQESHEHRSSQLRSMWWRSLRSTGDARADEPIRVRRGYQGPQFDHRPTPHPAR